MNLVFLFQENVIIFSPSISCGMEPTSQILSLKLANTKMSGTLGPTKDTTNYRKVKNPLTLLVFCQLILRLGRAHVCVYACVCVRLCCLPTDGL